MQTRHKMTAVDLAELGFHTTSAGDQTRPPAEIKSEDIAWLRPERSIGRFVAELKKRFET